MIYSIIWFNLGPVWKGTILRWHFCQYRSNYQSEPLTWHLSHNCTFLLMWYSFLVQEKNKCFRHFYEMHKITCTHAQTWKDSHRILFFHYWICFIVCWLKLLYRLIQTLCRQGKRQVFPGINTLKQVMFRIWYCQGRIQRFWKGGALYVNHHGWPAKKMLGFRWFKKAKITLETISFGQIISISIFKFSRFLSIKSY